MSINKVMFAGNVGQDPELKEFGSGCVLKFSMACTEKWTDKNSGDQKEQVTWMTVSVWGNRGKALHKFVKKGMWVFVSGKLRVSKYEKDGENRTFTEIVADDVQVAPRSAQKDQKSSTKSTGDIFAEVSGIRTDERYTKDEIPF